jgi:hypothetical protein
LLQPVRLASTHKDKAALTRVDNDIDASPLLFSNFYQQCNVKSRIATPHSE